jgi:hypothetical protein
MRGERPHSAVSHGAYGRYNRGAWTALPMRSMGACDQSLLHMVGVSRHGGRWVQVSSCGALWKMCSEP